MFHRLLLCALVVVLVAGCGRSREIEHEIRILDVETGWIDAGIVDGQTKVVPTATLRLQNSSDRELSGVQLNAIFRQVGDTMNWGEHLLQGIDSEGLAPGQTGETLVIRSNLGYTGPETPQQILQNSGFVDVEMNLFGRHGSRTWVKLGEFPVQRQLLTPE